MGKRSTLLTVACDFALGEALELYAMRYSITRAEALRQIIRQVVDPLGERSQPRPALSWVKVDDGRAVVWMLDGGAGRWAIARQAHSNAYPILTIEERWRVVYGPHQLTYSPNEFALYLAEGIILDFWPDMRPAPAITPSDLEHLEGLGCWQATLTKALAAV